MAKGNIFDYERVRSPDMTEQFKLVDDAFAIGKPYALATSYTILTADFGKSIRVASNSTISPRMTLASVSTPQDGAKLRFINIGAGGVNVDAADTDYIGDNPAPGGNLNSSTAYAVLNLEYVHSLTRWIEISHEGTWATGS